MVTKTKLEIINETVEYYGADLNRRGTDSENRCVYYTGIEGKLCAFGRCAINPKELDEKYGTSGTVHAIYRDIHDDNEDSTIDIVLKEEYRGYSLRFWSEIQTLHDGGHFWNREDGTGLSDSGNKYVQELKDKYNEI